MLPLAPIAVACSRDCPRNAVPVSPQGSRVEQQTQGSGRSSAVVAHEALHPSGEQMGSITTRTAMLVHD